MSEIRGCATSRTRAGCAAERGAPRSFAHAVRTSRARSWSCASYALVIFVALLCVLPFFYIVSASLKNSELLFQYPPEWIPARPYWGNYEHLLRDTLFPRWVFNTLLVAGAVTLIKVLIDSMSGYAFAKLQFPFKNVLFVVIIATLMIPFSTILVPLYFTVRSFGLLNSYWALDPARPARIRSASS